VRSDTALVEGEEMGVSGIDPATIDRFYAFDWAEGSERALERLGGDGAVVSQSYADANELAVGEPLSVTSPSGAERTLVVRGIHDPPKAKALLSDVSMTVEAFDAAFSQAKNSYTFLDAEPGAADDLTAAAAEMGDATLHTGEAYATEAGKELETVLAMLFVLLGFSVVVSLFGMVNTMVLSVFERTRELGMLRAIGMTRRQTRRMIRQESVITALIGAVLGLGLGILLAALVTKALSTYELGLTLPYGTLAAFTVVAVLAGIGAAILPARRASRLNVLEALHYE